MTDCPKCGCVVDGLFCRYCADRASRMAGVVPPPMGFDGLYAKCKTSGIRDREADDERAAIQAENAAT